MTDNDEKESNPFWLVPFGLVVVLVISISLVMVLTLTQKPNTIYATYLNVTEDLNVTDMFVFNDLSIDWDWDTTVMDDYFIWCPEANTTDTQGITFAFYYENENRTISTTLEGLCETMKGDGG